MQTSDSTVPSSRELPRGTAVPRRRGLRSLTEGGIDGNEQLTTIVGAILIVLLFVIGITILRIGQLISIHLFVGFLLLGPVALKMASTGYRFMRYYIGDRVYRKKGPPETWLRLLAPGVVLTTAAVFVTGVVLMFVGPQHRDPWLLLHKASFIVWIGLTGLHILGHLPAVARLFGINVNVGPRAAGETKLGTTAGGAGRWIAITGAIVAGLVLAIVLIPQFHLWTAHTAFPHHDG